MTRRIFISIFIKAFSAIVLFLLTRKMLTTLDTSDFAIISVFLSIYMWFMLMDIGIGSYLRNYISEIFAKGDNVLIYKKMTSCFKLYIYISVFIFVISSYAIDNLDLSSILNVSQYEHSYLVQPTMYFIAACIFSLPFTVFKSWLLATHHNESESFQNFLFYLIPFVFIVIFSFFDFKIDLALSSIIFSISIIFSNLFYAVYFFKLNKTDLLFDGFSFKLKLSEINSILSRSYHFFFIQISGLIIYSTGTFIINLYSGSVSATEYVLIMRLITVPMLIANVVISFYWSKMTSLYFDGKYRDANIITAGMMALWIVFCFILLLFYIFNADVLRLIFLYDSMGSSLSDMAMVICIYSSLMVFNNIWGTALSAIGKTRFGMFSAMIAAIINIPLGYYFCVVLDFGAIGVVYGTIIVLIPGVFISPFQYYLFYSSGIKNKKLKVVFS